MKKPILLLLFSFNFLVGFTQTKYYYNYYYGINGGYWMPVEKNSADYYSFTDMDTLTVGEITFYDTTGNVFAKDYYENQKLTQSRHYYKNGKKKYLLELDFNTKVSNVSIDLMKLNSINYTLNMKNFWDSLGSKIDMVDSCLFTDYYSNGKIMTEGKYYKGFPAGTWKVYYQNGNLMYQRNYFGMNRWTYDFILSSTGDTLVKNGKGKFTITYPDGKPSYTGEYVEGNLIGPFQAYYPNGQLWYKGNYSYGKHDGKYESYYVNGSVKATGNYMNGGKKGRWKWYDKQGRLIKSYFFESASSDDQW
jgi:antitoxin component YwqK of YwqJK toxin-antitoxin module